MYLKISQEEEKYETEQQNPTEHVEEQVKTFFYEEGNQYKSNWFDAEKYGYRVCLTYFIYAVPNTKCK